MSQDVSSVIIFMYKFEFRVLKPNYLRFNHYQYNPTPNNMGTIIWFVFWKTIVIYNLWITICNNVATETQWPQSKWIDVNELFKTHNILKILSNRRDPRGFIRIPWVQFYESKPGPLPIRSSNKLLEWTNLQWTYL